MNNRLGLLANELLLAGIIFVLSFLVGWKYYSVIKIEKMTVAFSIPWFLISFAVAVLLVILILRFLKYPIIFKVLLSIVIFVGAVIILNAFILDIPSLVLAAALVVLYWIRRTVIIHNLALIVCIAGVSVYFGLLLSPITVLVLLGVLSVYDLVAVFGTKHMITMFKGMANSGATFGLIIPDSIKGTAMTMKNINFEKNASERGFVFLGTGDLAFPAMLAVAALASNKITALCVIGGAIIGIASVHFILQKLNRPLPALPPIAIGSGLGYLIGTLI